METRDQAYTTENPYRGCWAIAEAKFAGQKCSEPWVEMQGFQASYWIGRWGRRDGEMVTRR